MLFEKIYIADIDKVSLDVEDSFLMCGNKNWDYYFIKKDDNVDIEELNNIRLREFYNKDTFQNFIKNVDYVDYQIENNSFKVLYYGKN